MPIALQESVIGGPTELFDTNHGGRSHGTSTDMISFPKGPLTSPPEHTDMRDRQLSIPTIPAPRPTYRMFFDLPVELIDQIISSLSSLDYEDACSFRLTCRAASLLIPFKRLVRMRKVIKALLVFVEEMTFLSHEELQNDRRYMDPQFQSTFPEQYQAWVEKCVPESLTCYACLKDLPRSEFASTQLQGNRRFGRTKFKKRFCIDCGWRKKIWERGSVRRLEKGAIIVCQRCGGLNRSNPSMKLRQGRVCSQKCLLLCNASTLRGEADWGAGQIIHEFDRLQRKQEQKRRCEIWEILEHEREKITPAEREKGRITGQTALPFDAARMMVLTLPSRATRC